jgi:ribose-phosphate pyrophosphokinase
MTVTTSDWGAREAPLVLSVPVDDLTAMDVLIRHVRADGPGDLVVVSPDSGFVKTARAYARRLKAPLAIADKRRVDHSERAEVLDLVGDVGGLNALLVDDFVISGHTLAETARCVMEHGARSVHAAVTHAVFSATAAQVIDRSPIASLVVTDSVEGHPAPLPSRCRVVSVAPLLAEAVRRIHERESISVLFDS